MSGPPIPLDVSTGRYVDAIRAFWETLGYPDVALLGCFPVVLSQDSIVFPAILSPDYGFKFPPAIPIEQLADPQGREHQEVQTMVRIEVIG